jgi:hypothetical protein
VPPPAPNAPDVRYELKGELFLRVCSETARTLQLQLDMPSELPFPITTKSHPHLDRKLFKQERRLQLAEPGRQYPLDVEVGVLKWKGVSTEANDLPLLVEVALSNLSLIEG